MDWLSDPQAWIALATLTTIEIVLGIDNIVFISILVSKLPAAQQARARFIGLSLAMGMRILLLLSISWVMRLTAPLFHIAGREISGRDLILIGGGLFLLAKATLEIHDKLEGEEHGRSTQGVATMGAVLVQIMLLDLVFSLDSVITAIGLAKQIPVMIIAIVLAVVVMMLSAGAVNAFIDRHPTVKMLALSFLLLIGLALVAEGVEVHIPKTSIYFAMAFSVFVEMLNIKVRGHGASAPVKLRTRQPDGHPPGSA